jgi:hypothetical protein
MNRIALPLVAACCIGLATWAAWERSRRAELEAENQSLLEEMSGLKAQASARTAREQSERQRVAALEKKIADLESGDSAGGSSGAAGGAGGRAARAMGEEMAKMFSDPKMRDVMKSQARMGVDMMYRDLFDLLNLPEPQRTEFEKLIMEKATAGMEAAFAMMGGDKSAEERKAASEEVKKKVEETDAKIRELLGQEEYDRVKRYEDSQMERMQLKAFTGMLASKDAGALDEEAETKLMDAMYQERQKFPFASNFADQQNPDISRFTAENAERFKQEYAQLNERIAKRAEGILTAPQLEVFRESQTQQMNMVSMQMEWGSKMFGADAAKSGDAK